MVYVGGGDFIAVGQRLVQFLDAHAGLQPDRSVLDVGCGIGRVAVALTRYLDAAARYEGFDIVPDAIRWCAENITPRHPNFNFSLVDVHNSRYNPNGSLKGSELEFPYGADEFDFVFLSSVFTHMLPDDMDHYVSEIGRVTRPGGRCVPTFYLLNNESLASLEAGTSRLDFPHDQGHYRIRKEATPEGAVAYSEDFVTDIFRRHGFDIVEIRYGRWSGTAGSAAAEIYQDAVIADLPGR
jgi:SAM-dependent methyltransferase